VVPLLYSRGSVTRGFSVTLEFFRAQQGVEKINAERDRDESSNQVFHNQSLSQARTKYHATMKNATIIKL
jgi:hypothetical protein